jgi:tetratricopeptide (TPR) repeat protein
MKTRLAVLSMFIALIRSAAALAMAPATTGNPAADSLVIQGRNLVDSGYVEWKKDAMLRGYALLQRASLLNPEDRYVEYYLAYAGYRLMTYGMAVKQDDIYKEFAERAEGRTEALARNYPDWSEPSVLLAAIYGIEIAHSWMNAPTLGPKSGDLLEKSLSIDSTNPRAYLILGTGKLNTPAIFGGSVEKAIDYFRESLSLYEAAAYHSRPVLEPTWGYVDALTWLGLAYEKQERYTDALSVYQKALQVDPNYARATYVLIPEVEKKIRSSNNK